MAINVSALAARISSEIGLDFVESNGRGVVGAQAFQLQPAHHPPAHTFTLHIQLGWRSIDLTFRPGNFAGELLQAMGEADESGRIAFASVLRNAKENGALIVFTLNGSERSFEDWSIWDVPWQNMVLSLRKGMLPINNGDASADEDLIGVWLARLSAAILALLPLEADESPEQANPTENVAGLPEGAKVAVVVNRYERDRRNRAAALAIHGHICKSCDIDMGYRYGAVAAGLIEVHHNTPVSQMGPGYIVNPRTDLVPLCPNCHAVAHRRDPPHSLEELRRFFRISVPE
jgi:5-methylcytosine-specific restriction protein A